MLRPNPILSSDIEAILVIAQSPGLSKWYWGCMVCQNESDGAQLILSSMYRGPKHFCRFTHFPSCPWAKLPEHAYNYLLYC